MAESLRSRQLTALDVERLENTSLAVAGPFHATTPVEPTWCCVGTFCSIGGSGCCTGMTCGMMTEAA